MRSFLRDEFDKLLLAGALLGFCVLAASDGGLSGFATDAAKTILGALLGLITGVALANRRGDPPTGGTA